MAASYRFDEFVVDPVAFVLTRAGQPVPIEPKAFDLLRFLLDHPNRILTKRELLDAVWKDVSVTDNVLARAVGLVRKALGDDARVARYVVTMPTRGYKFIAHSVRTPHTDQPWSSEPQSDPADTPESLPVTIAVLPFVNVGADAGTEHFSDGISEDILNALAHDSTLQVVARASSFAFRGGTVDLRIVAERLHVAFVLDGSVRRTGERVRITAQLVDAATGYQLWSNRFDRELTDIFAVQDDITMAVTSAVREALRKRRGAVSTAASAPSRRVPPRNLEAYEAFLKGRYLSHQRFVVMSEARGCFRQAIALDPSFAPAYAALAENYGLCAIYAALPATEAFLAMRRFAEEAQARDPELPDPHYLLASVALWFEWNANACDRHLRKALALEPHHAGALTLAAILAALRRQPDQAWKAASLATRVDPLGQETRTWLLAVAWSTGDFERQISEAGRLIDEHPGYGDAFRWRSMAYTLKGEFDRARADLETFGALTNTHYYTLVGLGIVAALEGNRTEARRIVDAIMDRSTREWVSPMAFGMIEQQLGNYDAALDWYERAYVARDFLLTALHVDPQFQIVPPGQTRPITELPRWRDLVERIGIAH